MTASPIVDFEALRRQDAVREPFAHLIVPGFIRAEAQGPIEADYPAITHPGSFPLASLQFGPHFADLVATLTGPEMTALVEAKLGIDLGGRPTTVTVRGISRAADGQIHTDSKSKLVTMLLYMNQSTGRAAMAACGCCAGPTISPIISPKCRRIAARSCCSATAPMPGTASSPSKARGA